MEIKRSSNNSVNKNIIKLQEKDFNELNDKKKFLTHFNLQVSHHKINVTYQLPKIIRRGHYKNDNDELVPVLDYENCFKGKCIEVREYLSYEDLEKEDFKYSFSYIKDVQSLKKAILERYTYSLPNLSEEEILSLGVSLTKLKILKRGES